MADETSTSSPNEKSWFSEISWKQTLTIAVLSVLFGGSGGGFVATKTSQAQGITQKEADALYLTKDKADVSYISIEAADKRGDKRDKWGERLEQKIDENQRKNETEQKEVRSLLNQILINQQSSK